MGFPVKEEGDDRSELCATLLDAFQVFQEEREVVLEQLRTSPGHNGPCLALGFGPGLTVEVALLMVQKAT